MPIFGRDKADVYPHAGQTAASNAELPTNAGIPVTTGEPEGEASEMLAADGGAAPCGVPESPAQGTASASQSPDAVGSFPEPLVLGAKPRLHSEPKGLPRERFRVPDSVLDGADLDGLAIRGASLRGDEHRYYGTTRQDSMSIAEVSDGHTVAYLACVADGVGSEPLSQHGSTSVCELAYEEVQTRLSQLFTTDPEVGLPALCQDLSENLAARLARQASYLKVDPKTLSTTLVCAVAEACLASARQRRCVVFAVGDSSAFLLREGKFAACFADQHDTMITSTGTNALPTSVGRVAAVCGELRPGDMLMICTDGMSNPMRNVQVTDRLAAWWGSGQVPGLPEFGWQLSFRAKSYGDDRTAVCFWGR